MTMNQKEADTVLGSYCITNCLYILVHEIDDVENRVLASSGRDDKRWCPMEEREDGEGGFELGFLFGKLFVPFSMVMRV